MSETTEKTIVIPESNNALCANMMGLLNGMCQKQGIDPSSLLAMMNNGGFSGNNFMWVIFLFFLMGNGWYGRNGAMPNATDADTMRLANLINNNDGRSQLLSAIEGNESSIGRIAQSINCSTGQVSNAINSLCSLVQSVGNQVGMTSQQVINAIQNGNSNIISQLQSCCCSVGNKIAETNYENRLAMCQQTNSLTNAINGGVQSINAATDARTDAIMARLDSMERAAMQSKIDALQETKSTLQTQLNLEHQTQQMQAFQAQSLIPINNAIAQMQTEISSIRANQLPTTTVPNPQVIGIPANLAFANTFSGLYGNGGFWY